MIFVAGISIGCATTFPIQHDTNSVKGFDMVPYPNIALHILPLKDSRRTVKKNAPLFTHGRETRVDGTLSFVNAEEKYDYGLVAAQVTAAFGKHVRATRIFGHVSYGPPRRANYYVKGHLMMLYGRQDYSVGAAVANSFGLIGAAIASGIETEGQIVIGLGNLEVLDSNNYLVATLPNIYHEFKGKMSFNTSCMTIYQHVNGQLGKAADQLAQQLYKIFQRFISSEKQWNILRNKEIFEQIPISPRDISTETQSDAFEQNPFSPAPPPLGDALSCQEGLCRIVNPIVDSCGE